MNVREFLARLDGVSESAAGGRWMARCPAHEDDTQSLSVSEGRDGRVLVKCFAGCPAERIVEAMGLRMGDIMGDAAGSPGGGGDAPAARTAGAGQASKQAAKGAARPRKKKGKVIATYLYRDADGSILYRVQRYEPKSFSISVPDESSPYGWAWGLSRFGRERVLYRLPEVLEAAGKGKVIFLTEGEKDADNLAALGVTATSASGGAEAEWLDGYTDALRGAALVAICADNDPEKKGKIDRFWAGQRRAWRVGAAIERAGIPVVRMVFPAPQGARVKDASDWIAAGGTADALKDLVRDYAAGRRTWPAEWRFEDGGGCQAGASPRPPGTPVTYRLGREKSIEIAVEKGKSIHENIEWWQFQAWKALQDEDGRGGRPLSRQARLDIAGIVTVEWLRLHGRFFWREGDARFDTSMYFSEDSGRLSAIRSDEMACYLSRESGINMSTPAFKFLYAAIDEAAMNPALSAGVIPAAVADRRGSAIYISCGDSDMVRIRAGRIEMVRNGTDGIVFLSGHTLKQWRLLPGSGGDPFDEAELFRGAAFADPKSGRMAVRLWLLGIFGCLKARPILCLTGAVRSGKTRMAKGLAEIIGYDPRISAIRESQTGESDFWVSMNTPGIVCFDNVDSRVSWFGNAIQVASTGSGAELRRLYRTEELVRMKPNAHVILTSNTPRFASDAGVADRLVIVRLDARSESVSDARLSADIEARRDRTMTWIARTVARAVVDRGAVIESLNVRHPDFAAWAQRCGRAMGRGEEAVAALRATEADKGSMSIQSDETAREVVAALVALRDEIPEGWEGTVSDISAKILERLGMDRGDRDARIYSGRYVRHAIERHGEELRRMTGLQATGNMYRGWMLYRLEVRDGEMDTHISRTSYISLSHGEVYENRGSISPSHQGELPESAGLDSILSGEEAF